MNKLITRRFRTLSVLMIIASSVTFAQLSNVDFLKSGAADGSKIIGAYLTPWANAFGAGLNGSWYNTAKPHKLGGFDITTAFNIGFVPTSAGTYNISDLELTTLSGSGTASTISGPKTTGPNLTKTVSGVQLASFTLPPGTNWKMIPVPTAQIGIGLPMGTELKFRYIPKLNIKNGDISLWGVGLMHSIMQYIPGSKMIPVDVSVFGGLTKLQSNIPISLQPGTPTNYVTYNTSSFDTQNMNASVMAWNLSVVGSLNIPLLTVYGGLGYSKTSTTVKLTGNFPTPVLANTPAPPHAEYNDLGVLSGSELPKIEIKNFSGIRANLGLRLKLGVITFFGDYTRSQYNVVSAGLGISFR